MSPTVLAPHQSGLPVQAPKEGGRDGVSLPRVVTKDVMFKNYILPMRRLSVQIHLLDHQTRWLASLIEVIHHYDWNIRYAPSWTCAPRIIVSHSEVEPI